MIELAVPLLATLENEDDGVATVVAEGEIMAWVDDNIVCLSA